MRIGCYLSDARGRLQHVTAACTLWVTAAATVLVVAPRSACGDTRRSNDVNTEQWARDATAGARVLCLLLLPLRLLRRLPSVVPG